jgi:hypothetical protein
MARALSRLLTPAFEVRCREVAKLAAGDNGLEVAVDWLEQMAEGKGNVP